MARQFLGLIPKLTSTILLGSKKLGWLGKDAFDMDLLSTDGQSVVRTKAVRRIGEEWDATLVLGVEIRPSQVFGHRQMKRKQKVIPLDAPILKPLMRKLKQS